MSYFRNVQNDGNWVRGNTYTFEKLLVDDHAHSTEDYVWHPTGPLTGYATGYFMNKATLVGFPVALFYSGSTYPVFATTAGANSWEPSEWSIGGSPYYHISYTGPGTGDMLLYPTCGAVTGAGWTTITVVVPANAPLGEYAILWLGYSYEVRAYFDGGGTDDPYFAAGPEIETREILPIEIFASEHSIPPADLTSFPTSRADAYDPDLFWIPGTWDWDAGEGDYVYTDGEWAEYGALIAIGGGRYNQQLVALGKDVVYFEDFV